MANQNVNVSIAGQSYNVAVSIGGGVPSPTGWFSVKAYGAVGDGATNDTTAIQAAIDACAAGGGGTVFFSHGTYKIASPFVEIPATAPILLVGDHAWLDGADTADHAFVFDNGDGAGSPTFEMVEFRDLWFKRFTNRAIECSPYDSSSRPTVTRLVVQGCRVNDSAYGFHFYCKIGSGLFEGNIFTELLNSTTDGATALFIGSKYEADQAATKNIIVRSNYAEGLECTAASSSTHAIVIFGHTVIVNGNIICDNHATGATPEGGMALSVKAYNVNISDNVCINGGGANDGHIYVKGLGRGDNTTGSNGGESYAINICDNVIISTIAETYNQSESGISVDGGPDGKDNVCISGNYIEGLRSNGIKIEGPSGHDDMSIVNNQIYGVRRDYGIRYVSQGKRLTIKGNRVVGFGADGSQTNPIGIRVDPVEALDVCEISGNLIADNALASGTGTLYGMFVRPSVGALTKLNITDNTIDMQTSRVQVGLYLSTTGSGTLGGGVVERNRVYVTAGNTAESYGGTGLVAINGMATATADDATPSVRGIRALLIPSNTGATAITQLDDSVPGQQVTIVLTNATNPSTIADSATFMLAAGAAWGGSIDDTITLFTVNGGASAVWREISRSAN